MSKRYESILDTAKRTPVVHSNKLAPSHANGCTDALKQRLRR
jgi:hypothetical protein